MLPENVHMANHPDAEMWWMEDGHKMTKVLDTELLHLCWLVEETLIGNDKSVYNKILGESGCDFRHHATWQQRVIALAKVKGVEIL